jgi:hypothetical protein
MRQTGTSENSTCETQPSVADFEDGRREPQPGMWTASRSWEQIPGQDQQAKRELSAIWN